VVRVARRKSLVSIFLTETVCCGGSRVSFSLEQNLRTQTPTQEATHSRTYKR
jgi:hypothetical protein